MRFFLPPHARIRPHFFSLSAYSTSPTDASFRSYLTEVSLHRHLHQLRQESPTPSEDLTEEQVDGFTRTESEKTSSPHILTFANRISVSLRTPRYERTDYGIFCTVTVPCTPLLRAGCAHHQSAPLTSTRYVGLFGKWWITGQVRTPKVKMQREGKVANGRGHDVWGVMRMKAGDTAEESDSVEAEKTSATKRAGGASGKTSAAIPGHEALPPTGGKPSGRRKKQAHKPKPLHLQAEGESTATELRAGDDSGMVSGSIASRGAENQERGPEAEQLSPPSSSAVPDTIGNADLQVQLEQVRLTSESSRKLLQAQLEELRSRKKDEDAVRLDVKGRMKTLDESKRHAEGTKREAERRLKAATGLRETLENRIESKVQEMKDWKAREGAQEVKVRESGEKKTSRIADMKREIQTKEQESRDAEAELDQLKAKLETIQQRLLEEEANLEAARELAAEREAAMMANRGYNAASSPMYHNTYPLLSGPGELSEHSLGDMSMESLSQLSGWNAPYAPYGASPNPQMSMTSDDIREDLDEKFDPTIAPVHVDNVAHHSAFAPFSYDKPAFQLQDIQPPASNRILGEGINVPPSPFTSDLLPSNLFQNADDDEKHIGVLPGSRSEQVEAALNRFGLDTSDTSDVGEDNGGDTADEEGEGGDDVETGDKELSRSANGTFRTAARSWWNARSRNASKDRSTSGNNMTSLSSSSEIRASPSVSALDTSGTDHEATKRRSLSIFPKLSLNPGAKSFRGSSKKVNVADTQFADYNDVAMQGAWNHSTGQLPTRQDFESMKRAFQTNNLGAAEQDDDEGRKSWSAFDTWQQMHNNSGPLIANRAINRPSGAGYNMNGSMYHTQRASSESLQPIRRLPGSSTSPQGVNWLDDVLLPLQKCQSIDDANSSAMPRNAQRMGKPSRFAFWSNNSNGPAPQLSSTLSASSSSSAGAPQAAGAEVEAQGPPPAEAPSSSAPPQPSKRTSFRWSRRSESSSMDVQAISDSVVKE